MRSGPCDLSGFLRHVVGTAPFVQYCAHHGIPFTHGLGKPAGNAAATLWRQALHALPEDRQARIARELAQVQALASPDATALLLAGAHCTEVPPDTVPGDAPLALWYFLHHPALFQEVFFQHEIADVTAWRVAMAPPGIACGDLPAAQAALAASLQAFFQEHEGTGRFCVVEGRHVRTAVCFLAHLSDRLQVQDVFTADGRQTTHTIRPAVPLLFAYEPETGRILLKTRQRAADRLFGLFQRFGRTVLGIDLDATAVQPLFRLDLLKRRFDPPLAHDVHHVRVKALHLAYPAREGRRRVTLETLSGDRSDAIMELVEQHGGERLEQLDVLYAELEVKLALEGRSRTCIVRLWPDRCSLDTTPLGERLFACLARWGLTHAPQP